MNQRSFREMSLQATLSPSPIDFRDPSSPNFFLQSRFGPANDNPPSFFERRRTSHPHNQHSQHNSQRASEDMPRGSQTQHRPALEHRASQTVIDLTDEPEEAPVQSRNNESRSRSQRPPHLGRSDAVSLRDLIDLTDDMEEVEVMITGERQLPAPRPSLIRPQHAPAERARSPSLFMPQVQQAQPVPRPQGFFHTVHRVFAGPLGLAAVHLQHPQFHFNAREQDFMDQLHNNLQHQPMPGVMDYGNAAWADRKPEHVPPPKARDNFTRSPVEEDTIICPSCEQELVHNKDNQEPPLKKSSKAPTRKDREEHPFWVVKECGHVSYSILILYIFLIFHRFTAIDVISIAWQEAKILRLAFKNR